MGEVTTNGNPVADAKGAPPTGVDVPGAAGEAGAVDRIADGLESIASALFALAAAIRDVGLPSAGGTKARAINHAHAEHMKFFSGRHAGRTIGEVARVDMQYLAWFRDQERFAGTVLGRAVKSYLKNLDKYASMRD